jgi:transposase
MAIIPQMKLFDWVEIENLGDLVRLQLVLEAMLDEKLMKALEKSRGKGRNDYPVRAMWNSVLAGVVFQHDNVEKLRRELARNGQLRALCGFEGRVPQPWDYTRFLKTLMKQETLIEKMFEELVKQLAKVLPGFGKRLAIR